MVKHQVYFLLFVCALFLAIVSPMLLSDGMFMDGIYYATIARNWAEGLGTFWKPRFTDTLGNPFYDHPPLVFFLEGIFFKVMGDHYWVERIYSVLTHFVMGFLLWKIWINVSEKKYHKLFWVPLLFWISIGKVTWSACNNLLENTLMLFTSLSILYLIKAVKNNKPYLHLIAGAALFLGFLAKGFVTFFPLGFLFFYWLFNKKYSFLRLLKEYIYLLAGLLLPFTFLYFFIPEGIEAIENYIRIQVVNSLENVQTVDSRFFILRKFFQESLIMIGITIVLHMLNRIYFKHKLDFKKEQKTIIFTLVCVVFSGILPILISLKQSTFYINPVFPIAALIAGLIAVPIIFYLLERIKWKSKGFSFFKVLSLLFGVISIVLVLLPANEVRRDKKRLSDIRAIIEEVGERNTIFLSPEISQEWSLHAYFYRYGHLSLHGENPEKYTYMISGKGAQIDIPEGFKIYRNDLNELDLYIRK